MNLVIVTGLSGAGKTTVIRFMEDIEYYVADNMPPSFLPKFAELCLASAGRLDKAAVVCDSRVGGYFSEITEALENLDKLGVQYQIVFLEASDDVLIRRYKETRRKHPLQRQGQSLSAAITAERTLLESIRCRAASIIDTTNCSNKTLLEILRGMFAKDVKENGLKITVMSFGFKYGIPLDADLVFDVRFLPNPYYIDELKGHNGTEACVADYVMKFKESVEFYAKLLDMIRFLLPYYIEEGKSGLMIAIGCTGGRHRSVTLAERLYKDISEDNSSIVVHRDYMKG